ncbi:hypothetical protein Z948_1425 [Sulfitobacter donghicola DSW-25 = KCTC 12864 = JCM 14565]|nr:hypothetical protein Z948_1425 [Sulfitobacter donghicola DSW-25 = KCTC 12864 = JCM 14565]
MSHAQLLEACFMTCCVPPKQALDEIVSIEGSFAGVDYG